jgi:hypothetical protein
MRSGRCQRDEVELSEKEGAQDVVLQEKKSRTSKVSEACHRCGGLMVPERTQDRYMTEWRCVSCGDRIDAVILAHRAQYKDKAREEDGKFFSPMASESLN